MKFKSDVDVELVDYMGSDLRVAQAAWVSTMGERAEEGDEKRVFGLINFLLRDRHGSPFESSIMQFRTSAPIFVWREHMRHRICSYSEESGRYKKLEPVFYIPDENRKLVQTGRVGDYSFDFGTELQVKNTSSSLKDHSSKSYEIYMSMLEAGIAREVARMALSSNIYSTAYVTINLRSLMNFLSLRNVTDDTTVPTHPMREIEMVAEKYESFFQDKFPMTHEAFVKNGRVAP